MWHLRSTRRRMAIVVALLSMCLISIAVALVWDSSPLVDASGHSFTGDYASSLNQLLDANPEWGPIAYVLDGFDAARMAGVRAVPVDLNKDIDIARYSHIAIYGDLPNASKRMGGLSSAFACQQPVCDLDGKLCLYETKSIAESIAVSSGERAFVRSDAKVVLPSLSAATGLEKPSVSGMLHMLLLSSDTGDLSVAPISGSEAFRLLTNEAIATAAFGRSPFVRTRNGIRYRLLGPVVGDGLDVGESHRDQCLGVFAGLGYSIDTPIVLDSGKLSFRDLLAESIANFSFEQDELSWTAHAYATYVAPKREWTDRFGKTTTFSELLSLT